MQGKGRPQNRQDPEVMDVTNNSDNIKTVLNWDPADQAMQVMETYFLLTKERQRKEATRASRVGPTFNPGPTKRRSFAASYKSCSHDLLADGSVEAGQVGAATGAANSHSGLAAESDLSEEEKYAQALAMVLADSDENASDQGAVQTKMRDSRIGWHNVLAKMQTQEKQEQFNKNRREAETRRFDRKQIVQAWEKKKAKKKALKARLFVDRDKQRLAKLRKQVNRPPRLRDEDVPPRNGYIYRSHEHYWAEVKKQKELADEHEDEYDYDLVVHELSDHNELDSVDTEKAKQCQCPKHQRKSVKQTKRGGRYHPRNVMDISRAAAEKELQARKRRQKERTGLMAALEKNTARSWPPSDKLIYNSNADYWYEVSTRKIGDDSKPGKAMVNKKVTMAVQDPMERLEEKDVDMLCKRAVREYWRERKEKINRGEVVSDLGLTEDEEDDREAERRWRKAHGIVDKEKVRRKKRRRKLRKMQRMAMGMQMKASGGYALDCRYKPMPNRDTSGSNLYRRLYQQVSLGRKSSKTNASSKQ